MKKVIYVVKLGGDLYAKHGYGLFHGTTKEITRAAIYNSYDDANKACGKTIGGTVEEYILQDSESYKTDHNEIRSAYRRLQEERDDALARLTKYEGTIFKK